MNYREAFKIGSKCDGYIKCTYAELMNSELGVLFSLQKRYFSENSEKTLDTAIGREPNTNADAVVNWIYEVPVVATDKYSDIESDRDFVPVYLTEFAKQSIAEKLRKRKTIIIYELYRVYKDNYYANDQYTIIITKGTKELVSEGYDKPDIPAETKLYRYKIETRTGTIDPNAELIAALKEKKHVFYVKACAIDWCPTDIVNATVIDKDGNAVKITDALDLAYKKMQSAKALLAVAGTSIII